MHRSSKPILVTRFMPRDGGVTEPSMSVVVPAQQYKSQYEFVVPEFGSGFSTYLQVGIMSHIAESLLSTK